MEDSKNDVVRAVDELPLIASTSGSDAVAVIVAPANSTNGLVSEHEEDQDDDESEYEYEDEDETNYGGFLEPDIVPQPARIEDDSTNHVCSHKNSKNSSNYNESSSNTTTTSQKAWREPSQAAVTMSLRAEKETTGGKRRLASDLYKIMTADTAEAGFSLEPRDEDSMDKWTIKLFQFDSDSNLAKDLLCLGLDHVELEMSFPDQYPFEPPFVRVVRPKFKKQSGFVMNGALCMELLTKDGWNPVNDIESVIVSIRSLLVVGDGRVQAAVEMSEAQRQALLDAAAATKKRPRDEAEDAAVSDIASQSSKKSAGGSYSMAEAQAAYTHLSDYHKKKGWDNSGWWKKKG